MRDTRACAGSIELDGVDAPLVLASADGVAEQATAVALELMQRLSVCPSLPGSLPSDLWRQLEEVAPGQAIEWRPPERPQWVLGCSRYRSSLSSIVYGADFLELAGDELTRAVLHHPAEHHRAGPQRSQEGRRSVERQPDPGNVRSS